MIAESPSITSETSGQHKEIAPVAPQFSLKRIVASLQILLAARREARRNDHAFWYTIARGL